MKLTDLHKEILSVCVDDDIMIGSVVWHVNGGPYSSIITLPEEVKKKTLEVLYDLLHEGLVEAGIPPLTEKMEKIMREDVHRGKLPLEYLLRVLESSERIWKPSSLSIAEIIGLIGKEWNNIDLSPAFIWFRATASGEQFARRHLSPEMVKDTNL